MSDFIKPWHIPLILGVFPILWLVLGGYLFQQGLVKFSTKRRTPFSEGLIASLLCGGVGGALGVAPLLFLVTKSRSTGILVLVALLAPILFYAIGVMTFSCLHQKVKINQVLRICTIPLIAIALSGGLIATACIVPTIIKHRESIANLKRIQQAGNKMSSIYNAFERNFNNMPDTLEELVKRGWIDADSLTSPILEGKSVGYLYAKPVVTNNYRKFHNQILLIAPNCKALGENRILILTRRGDRTDISFEQLNKYLTGEESKDLNAHWLPLKDKLFQSAD
ncbi:MAG: hypothetical protein HN909_05135 [Phycisphaerales bacterium]|nr:hypothetical protein [Phycisphaerales bacterium]MBT7171136.1 hypothetical protein [Phycisphaerales bacterium]